MEMQEQIIQDLAEIKASLRVIRPSIIERIFWLIEKALIPLAIAAIGAAIAFSGNKSASSIATTQAAQQQQADLDRKEEFRRTMQAKYIELFYSDISSGTKERQNGALQLLKLMEPALAEDLLKVIIQNPEASQALKEKAKTTGQEIVEANSLRNYKIGIYYLGTDTAATKLAMKINQSLLVRHIGKAIKLYGVDDAFMRKVYPPRSLEIRYEEGLENPAADELAQALEGEPLSLSSTKLAVGTATRQFISIFVPNGD